MTDDIVARLRQEWEYGNNAKGCDYEMFSQAADEIERLRADRDRWREIAGRLVMGAEYQLDEIRFMRLPLKHPKWLEAWHAYDRAVRGE